MRKWIREEGVIDLVVDDITNNKINSWQHRFIFSVNTKHSEELIGDIRTERDLVNEGMKVVFEQWQKEKGRDFHD